jgi:aminomethyltransferase
VPPPQDPAPASRRSPLHEVHEVAGATFGGFAGWELPLRYPTGTVAEHLACRRAAALFDVSHLGSLLLEGPSAFDTLQAALSNDLRRIGPGRAQYSLLLEPDGRVADDLMVWWEAPERFWVLPNAAQTALVAARLGAEDRTAERALLALQGPRARSILQRAWPEAADVGHFQVAQVAFLGGACVVAGTGYTGEDGVEIAVPLAQAPALWEALVGAGASPAGLAARDTLRLEAGLPLMGQDLGGPIGPLEAGLGWAVGWEKPELPAREVLLAAREAGPRRRLRGLLGGRRPLRAGAPVEREGQALGTCTSGSLSPVLGQGIALALLTCPKPGRPVPDGTAVRVLLRRGEEPATVVTPPFTRLRPEDPGAPR